MAGFRLKQRERVLGHFTLLGVTDEGVVDPEHPDVIELDGIPDPADREAFAAFLDSNRVIEGGTLGQFGWEDTKPVTYVRGEHPDWFRAFFRAMLTERYDVDWLTHLPEEPVATAGAERFLLATLEMLARGVEPYLRRASLELRGVYLRNHYPDTQLLVTCWDEARHREGAIVFNAMLWAGNEESAKVGASIVLMNIEESSWIWDLE